MSLITLDSVVIKKNPAMFSQPIPFEVTFTSLHPLQKPLQWKVIYVGSAKSQQHDQILEEFEIGPFEDPSTMKFQIECSPPDYKKIPSDQLLCVTALILTVSYQDQQFIRVGYYVHNQFLGEDQTDEADYPIMPILITSTKRTIITDKPRITHFSINWFSKKQEDKYNENSQHDSNSNNISKLSNQQEQKQKNKLGEISGDKFSTESLSLHGLEPIEQE